MTSFLKIPGSFPLEYRSGTGCSQRHPNHFDDGISSSVEACLTISTNFNVPLTRNPGGPSGQTRTSRIWQRQVRSLLFNPDLENIGFGGGAHSWGASQVGYSGESNGLLRST